MSPSPLCQFLANNDSYSVLENTILTVGAPGVLGNDVGSGSRRHCNRADEWRLDIEFKRFIYLHAQQRIYWTRQFYLSGQHIRSNSSAATVNITVTPDQCVANNQNFYTIQNSKSDGRGPGVLTNDSGGSGPLSAILAGGPSGGTLSLSSNGAFTYTPTNNFSGVDSFNYQATDGTTTSSVATVTIDVDAARRPVLR